MNEYPDFLNGEERENTVHIVVKYKADEAKSKRLSSNDTPDSSSINHSTLVSLNSHINHLNICIHVGRIMIRHKKMLTYHINIDLDASIIL